MHCDESAYLPLFFHLHVLLKRYSVFFHIAPHDSGCFAPARCQVLSRALTIEYASVHLKFKVILKYEMYLEQTLNGLRSTHKKRQGRARSSLAWIMVRHIDQGQNEGLLTYSTGTRFLHSHIMPALIL